MIPIVGFTGTQRGMTDDQKEKVKKILFDLRPYEVHHGDCIGADADFHEIAFKLGLDICIHPPINSSKRAFCKGAFESFKPLEYLERNRRIVVACDILIATPGECEEQLRSGTWATIRYARKSEKKVIIIYPEGAEDGW